MVVYSRWCGELISDIQHCGAKRGLSPLARGTPIHILINHQNKRFIPAGAGNSPCAWWTTTRMAVYPRWRGELAVPLHQRVQNPGLSPLARGTRCCLYRTLRESRFIPAGAGNSYPYWNTWAAPTVYPRWRGELFFQLQHCCCIDGLSPLARGTLNQVVVLSAAGRFIPAGAGNSARQAIWNTCCSVYPRWRGELAPIKE